MTEEKNIKTLVLSGGGIKGIAQIGAIQYMYENNYINGLEYIIGTSVGSIIGLFICLKLKPSNVFDFFCGDFINMLNLNKICFESFLCNYGFNKTDKVKNFLDFLIKKRLDKPNETITFADLYAYSNYRFDVVTTCINDKNMKIFNYIDTPNMDVIKAIIMSISIPGLFCPIEYENKLYADGGLCYNYPINLINDYKNTIGIAFSEPNNIDNCIIDCLESYMYNIILTFYKYQNNKLTKEQKDVTITIDNLNVEPFDFVISNEKKKELFDIGYKKAKSYFSV